MDILTPLSLTVFTIGIKRTIEKIGNFDLNSGVTKTFTQWLKLLILKATTVINRECALCGGGAVDHIAY